jgi:dUTP pyrophosphatase
MLNAKVKVKKLDERAIIPTYGTEFSAGADLYALPGEAITIPAHTTVLIHTGLSMEIPEGYAGLIFARSGMATKRGLAPANKVGVIDSDYRGEFMVALHNHTDSEAVVEGGERVAQLSVVPFLKAEFELSDELSSTDRGAGGFGSTGTK